MKTLKEKERDETRREDTIFMRKMLGKEWKIMFRVRWDNEKELNVRRDRERGPRGRPVPIIAYQVPAGQSLVCSLHRSTNTFQGVDRS